MLVRFQSTAHTISRPPTLAACSRSPRRCRVRTPRTKLTASIKFDLPAPLGPELGLSDVGMSRVLLHSMFRAHICSELCLLLRRIFTFRSERKEADYAKQIAHKQDTATRGNPGSGPTMHVSFLNGPTRTCLGRPLRFDEATVRTERVCCITAPLMQAVPSVVS